MDFRRFPPWLLALVCLGFTGPAVAWAESPRSPRAPYYVEDPMAPHNTTGATARVGTAVGFIYGERIDVLALGGTVAVGHRSGRLALEAEYAYLGFQVKGPSSLALGDGQRLGMLGRFDVIRLGPRIVGGNSLLSIYVEGGAGVAWNDWYMPAPGEPSRIVPLDSKRVEGQVGFGIEIDHRLQEPIGFPHRVGWFLGWRLALSPHEAEPALVCRGVSCSRAPMMPHDRFTDRSMLFQSSLAVTW
jgi:hypothetical protein